MTRNLILALLLVTAGTIASVACLLDTTAVTMTVFFSLGLPAYGVAALLYVIEVLRDLRSHRVL